MKFLLHINADPSSPFAAAAYDFANALVNDNQEISTVFFSGLAVSTFAENTLNTALASKWSSLLTTLSQKAHCCSAATSHHLNGSTIPSYVEISGLGLLIEASERADKVISFGS